MTDDEARSASDRWSGEKSDPRDGESRRDSEPASGERGSTEERPSEGRTGSEATREASDPRAPDWDGDARSDDSEDIPLKIAGHDSREPPGDAGNGSGPLDPDDADGPDGPDGKAADGPNGNGAGDDPVEPVEEGILSAVEPVDETEDDEVEPVELLVQLAKDGEIEPWDIDIVTVTDEFLERLDESDLRAGGRALFYASVLLRMKSDAMLDEGEPLDEEPRDAPMEDPAAEEPAVDPFDQLEREMDRRLERKHARGTPQTLDELVRELRDRERETYWKSSRSYDTSESPHGYARGTQELDYRAGDDFRMDDEPTEADAFGRTHDEHMEDTINEVYMALREQYDAGREEVLFREIREAGGSRVDTFLGLLFLSHRGQVTLQQDELFGDLWIQDPAAVAEGEEVVAD
jgi:segregation and condensation protein A